MTPGFGGSRFLLLALAADVAELSGDAVQRLWERYSPGGRLSSHIKSMEEAGWIKRSGNGSFDRRLYRLTPQGHNAALGEFDPEARWSRPWDGRWRIVAFDVPEKHASLRTRLRRRLRELRFGWLQNSVWISPDSLETLRAELGSDTAMADSLLFLEAQPAAGESDADLVTGAWDFERLKRDHGHYLELLQSRPHRSQQRSASALRWMAAEQRAWQRLGATDPFLPDALLPAGYQGKTTWRARVEALQDFGRGVRDNLTPA